MHRYSLEALLQQQIELNGAIAQSIFDTTSIKEITALLNGYSRQQFEQEITACSFAYLSVGATFIVHLSNKQQIVLKAYGDRYQLSNLRTSFQVQQSLAQQGFPCPAVLARPQQIGRTTLTAQGFHPDPYTQAITSECSTDERVRLHLPSVAHIRQTMAQHLAMLIRQCKHYPSQGLTEWMELEAPGLWHTPHNVLFDFEKTKQGAEWIDEIAYRAKQVLLAARGPIVIGHSDWSLQNMSFAGKKLACVYDWDSLRVGLEPCFVGGAARVYRHDWRIGPPKPVISVTEMEDFISAYEIARAQPFTGEEHQVIGAAIVYTAAYGVRCAHAVRALNNTHSESAEKQLLKLMSCFLTGS